METWSIIITVIILIISWALSTIIFWKFESKLRGKVWLIGIVGIIGIIGLFWLIAYFTTINVLMPIVVAILPWWLNYMFFLTKSKIKKERIKHDKF